MVEPQKRIALLPLQKALRKNASSSFAKRYASFFKTEKGTYGDHEKFLGVPVPTIRKLCSSYFKEIAFSFDDVFVLLESDFHEERFAGLVLLIKEIEFRRKKGLAFDDVVKFYLKHIRRVNDWDLVDISAPNILGVYLLDAKGKKNLFAQRVKVLSSLSRKKSLWEKRIGLVSTLKLVRAGFLDEALQLCEFHLNDDHDLMNKAVGWVLREIGKQDETTLLNFLDKYANLMPRVSLRYAIERLSKAKRKYYLGKC